MWCSDPTAATLHSTLLLHASQPYCRMLLHWITTGYLSDPFDEFMVRERGHINKGVLESDYTDEYWERRYTVRTRRSSASTALTCTQLRDGSSLATSSKVSSSKSTPSLSAGVPPPRPGTNRLPGGACIPLFLQAWKHKILLAGKYLNVIRECGIEVKKPGDVDEPADQMVVMAEPAWVQLRRFKLMLQLLQADRGRLYLCQQDSPQAHAGRAGADTASTVNCLVRLPL